MVYTFFQERKYLETTLWKYLEVKAKLYWSKSIKYMDLYVQISTSTTNNYTSSHPPQEGPQEYSKCFAYLQFVNYVISHFLGPQKSLEYE